jgi:hypothetical protein
MIDRLIQEVSEVALVEARPRQEGPFLTAILAPKKAPGKSGGGGQKAATAAPAASPAAPAAPRGSSGG